MSRPSVLDFTRARCIVGLLLLLALAATARAQGTPGTGDVTPWRVALIRNWDSLYQVNVVRERAMRQAIIEGAPRSIEIYPEELDPLRFPGMPESELVAALEQKYRATPIDVVIASGLEPLEFVVRHRDRLWPGAAIVFNGVIAGSLEGWTRPARTTGLMMSLDVAGTLDLGLALVPSARKVYFITGTAQFDRTYLDIALRAARQSKRPLDVEVLTGMTHEQAAERVATLEPDSLVVYLTMLRDGAGKYSGPDSPILPNIAARSRPPMLTAIHTQFGRGALGGSSSRFDEHGRAAGRLVRQVLAGADPDEIPIRVESPPSCEVDWRALQRWKISERNVPTQCQVTNQPPSIWKTYFWEFIALITVIVLQSALLWVLVMQSRRRRRAETQLATRGAEIAQVTRISMMGALTANIAHEINQPMGAILSNAEAALMMLDQGTLDSEKLRAILTDIRDEDMRAAEVIRSVRAFLARSEWKPEALELNSEVAEALSHVALDAARRGVRLEPRFDNEVPAVMGDAVQLQQVIINLVLNAMDAVVGVPEYQSEIRIETHASGDGAEITVVDRGPGLKPEDAARVFQSAFTTKKDGMGFGLSIVRTIVELHRGRVSFEPNLPSGAVFRVWLPAIGV